MERDVVDSVPHKKNVITKQKLSISVLLSKHFTGRNIDHHDNALLINSCVEYILTRDGGLAIVARHLKKTLGEFGGHPAEYLTVEENFNTVNHWFCQLIFGCPVEQFILNVLNSSLKANHGSLTDDRHLKAASLLAAINAAIDKPQLGPGSRYLSAETKTWIINEIIFPIMPTLSLDSTKASPFTVGTLNWGYLHAGMRLANSLGLADEEWSIEEMIQLGYSLEDMLAEGALPEWMSTFFDLSALFYHIYSTPPQSTEVLAVFFQQNSPFRQRVITDYFSANSQLKESSNPFILYHTAIDNFKTRTKTAEEKLKSDCPLAEGSDYTHYINQYKNGPIFCETKRDGTSGYLSDIDSIYSDQIDNIASLFIPVDGLLIAHAFEKLAEAEQNFISSAAVYTASAYFSAIGSLRTQQAIRVIPRHSYTVSLSHSVDLFSATAQQETRMYALESTAQGYSLSRVDEDLSLYYELMEDPQKCRTDSDYKLKINYHRIESHNLKDNFDNVEEMISRLVERHKNYLKTQLHQQGYEETTQQHLKRILLPIFIPFYGCYTGARDRKTEAIPACLGDLVSLLPVGGMAVSLSARFAQRTMLGSIVAFRRTISSLAARQALSVALKSASGHLIKYGIAPAMSTLDRKALTGIGISTLDAVFPGVGLSVRMGHKIVRQIINLAKKTKGRIGVLTKLQAKLEQSAVLRTHDITPHHMAHFAGLEQPVPVVRLLGHQAGGHDVYLRVNPDTNTLYGTKYTLSAENTLQKIPLPLARRLHNILHYGLSGRGAPRAVEGLGSRNQPSGSQGMPFQDISADQLIKWADYHAKNSPGDMPSFAMKLGISLNQLEYFARADGSLTIHGQRLLSNAGIGTLNEMMSLPPELQKQILSYLDLTSLKNVVQALPVLPHELIQVTNLRALSHERINSLRSYYYSTWESWCTIESHGSRRWLASSSMMTCLENAQTDLSIGGLNLRTLPVHFPPSVRKLDVSANHLPDFNINWPPALAEVNFSFNQLNSFPTFPDSVVTIHAQSNRIASLDAPLPLNLVFLDLSNNRISSLSVSLPPMLAQLNLNGNQLTTFDTSLPPMLRSLQLQNNRLTRISANLPSGVLFLDVSRNLLTQISHLPKKLIRFIANDNSLQDLPTLPITLKHLDIANNNVMILPKLPNKIQYVNAGNNVLVFIDLLPDDITVLMLNDNIIMRIRGDLPLKLKSLIINNNLLGQIPAWPANLQKAILSHNQLTLLPEAPIPPSLRLLDVSHNYLTAIPEGLPINTHCHFTPQRALPPQ